MDVIVSVRVLVVEDDPTVSEVVVSYLSREGFDVRSERDGRVALQHAVAEVPDLMVLDLMLPGMDGLEVFRRVREVAAVPTIMLTARGDESDRVLGLEIGADDYVSKPFSPRELTARVKSVLRRTGAGMAPTDPTVNELLRAGDVRVDPLSRHVTIGDRPVTLTAREFDLIAFLMRHPGQVFRREELLEHVWGYSVGDTSTVTVHIRRLREKIEREPSTPTMIQTVGCRVPIRAMSGRAGLIVAVAGLAAVALAAMVLGMPAQEAVEICGIAIGAAVVSGTAGLALTTTLRRCSIGLQVIVITLVSVIATGAGAWLAANAMFLAREDLKALWVILLASATTGVLVGIGVGHRVSVASRALQDAARRMAMGDLKTSVAEPPTQEFSALARELDAMSRRLDEALDRERALDASRREMTAWVSHDLRTPLAGIRAVAEALEDGVADDPETVARYHRTLRVEAERLTRLVDDLFELSVIDSGALRLRLETMSLSDLVSDAIASAAASARGRGVRLHGEVWGKAPTVEVSAPEFGRVLRNLMENAIRHTPADGAVRVRAGADHATAFVTISDECGGIPAADLERVFEPAFRGEPARTPADGGAGLGLAIARGLAEAHHGDITVRNGGRGCCFTLRLPISHAMQSALR
jgi:DNA-binding response OmpR family regulator/signal transduction histidine kinase